MINRCCDLANGVLIKDWYDSARPVYIEIRPGVKARIKGYREEITDGAYTGCVLIPADEGDAA